MAEYPEYPVNPNDIVGYCRLCARPFKRSEVDDVCPCGCAKAAFTRSHAEMPPHCADCDRVATCTTKAASAARG